MLKIIGRTFVVISIYIIGFVMFKYTGGWTPGPDVGPFLEFLSLVILFYSIGIADQVSNIMRKL